MPIHSLTSAFGRPRRAAAPAFVPAGRAARGRDRPGTPPGTPRTGAPRQATAAGRAAAGGGRTDRRPARSSCGSGASQVSNLRHWSRHAPGAAGGWAVVRRPGSAADRPARGRAAGGNSPIGPAHAREALSCPAGSRDPRHAAPAACRQRSPSSGGGRMNDRKLVCAISTSAMSGSPRSPFPSAPGQRRAQPCRAWWRVSR